MASFRIMSQLLQYKHHIQGLFFHTYLDTFIISRFIFCFVLRTCQKNVFIIRSRDLLYYYLDAIKLFEHLKYNSIWRFESKDINFSTYKDIVLRFVKLEEYDIFVFRLLDVSIRITLLYCLNLG